MTKGAPAAFFSYCREDSNFALRLAGDLKGAGASVWLDQLDISPGQRWDRAVEDALANCQRMVVILSPISVNSTNVMDEVSFALEERKTVIPVIYKDCMVPFRLRRVQYVDFRQDYARGLNELLKTLAPELETGQSSRPGPDEERRREGVARRQAAEQALVDQERHPRTGHAQPDEEHREAAERKQVAEQSKLDQDRKEAAKDSIHPQTLDNRPRLQVAPYAHLSRWRRALLLYIPRGAFGWVFIGGVFKLAFLICAFFSVLGVAASFEKSFNRDEWPTVAAFFAATVLFRFVAAWFDRLAVRKSSH